MYFERWLLGIPKRQMLEERHRLSIVEPTREVGFSSGSQCYLISIHVGNNFINSTFHKENENLIHIFSRRMVTIDTGVGYFHRVQPPSP